MRMELITCLDSVGEAKLMVGGVQFLFFVVVMYGYVVLQTNLSKLCYFIFMEYKGNWPKNYDTSTILRANTITKYFSQSVASLRTVYFTKLKKLLFRPIVKESDSLCWSYIKRKYSR